MAKKSASDTGKRPFESKYEENGLREMILSGMTADEIQNALGVVSRQSLRQHVLKLIHRDRTFYEIPGLYVRNLTRPFVNVKGEIKISKKMLDFQGSTYAPNVQFEIEADNERIILTRIEDNKEEDPNPTAEDGGS